MYFLLAALRPVPLLVAVLCTSCTSTPLPEGDGLYYATVSGFTGPFIQVGLASDCEMVATLGFDEAVPSPVGHSVGRPDPLPLGMLAPGSYGLAVRAIAGDCRELSFGCRPIRVEETEAGEVIFEISTQDYPGSGESLCPPLEPCAIFDRCDPPADAGTDAASSPDSRP
ncbi:MAG: hypothetical protein AB8H86_21430 [Polyangiales bacterium]